MDRPLMERLTRPSEQLVEDMARLGGDLMVLGAGGKISPTLAIKAKRALTLAGMAHKVYAASVFGRPDERALLADNGVEVIDADFSDPRQLAALPHAPNVVYMAGRKFGTSRDEAATWAVNVLLAADAARRYASSRIVVFSTGNVYGPVGVGSGGAAEDAPLRPVGEYAQSCVGRERALTHLSAKHGTPLLLLRLNYAIDLRYGVLYDIAEKVYGGVPVDLSAAAFNCVWQGDAAEAALRSLPLCKTPPAVLNITGPETIGVAWAARAFGLLFGREPILTGEPAPTALLSNAAKAHGLFGYPQVTLAQMMEWTAEWIGRGGETIDAPTHFESCDGKY